MNEFFQRLKKRKLVQWTVAYVAAAFALLQGLDIVANRFDLPSQAIRLVIVAMIAGLFVVLVLAWYHGERGAQRVSGTELLIIGLVLAVGGGFLWFVAAHTAKAEPKITSGVPVLASPAPATPIPEKSIAVLPFVNMSSDKEQDYFSDGLSEELLNQLAQVPQLRVLARTSSFSFKGKEVDVSTIAKALNVANVLEGSVRKSATFLRITAQLVRTSDSTHLWSQTYDRQLTDVFKAREVFAHAPSVWGPTGLAMLEHTLGHESESQKYLAELKTEYAIGFAYQIAQVHAWRGERGEAITWLEKAYDLRDAGLFRLRYDPIFASLRDDPRFAALVKKMQFAE